MKTLEELATDTTAIADILPKVIIDQVERVARAKRFGRNLVQISEQLVRTKGRSIVIPRLGSATAVHVAEGAAASKGGVSFTAHTITPDKIGYTAQITQEALDGQDFDLINLSIEEAGVALADKEDTDVVNELSGYTAGSETVSGTFTAGQTITLSFSGSDPLMCGGITQVVTGGVTHPAADIVSIDFYDAKFKVPAGHTFTNPVVSYIKSVRDNWVDANTKASLSYEDLVDGAAIIRGNKWNPNFVLINPAQMGDLLKSSKFIDASQYGDREALVNGEIGKISGMKVLVSTQMCDGTVLILDSKRAAWEALKRPVDMKRWDNPTTDSVELYFFMEYGVAVTDEDAVVLAVNSSTKGASL
jgi:N4-gp56 family major capsid protein